MAYLCLKPAAPGEGMFIRRPSSSMAAPPRREGAELSICGISSGEMVWESTSDKGSSRQLRGGFFGGDAHHLFGKMSSQLGGDSSAVLRVTMSHIHYPVTSEVLHQVYDAYGAVAGQVLAMSDWHVEALMSFMSGHDAERVRSATHVRNIYDGCCQLGIQYTQSLLGGDVDMTPTKCSMSGPSSATTRPVAECSPTAPEHVFPVTTNPSTPSAASAAVAPPVSLTATMEDEADMGKVEDKSEKTFHDLCLEIKDMINQMLVTCRDIKVESTTIVDITRVVAATSTNTKSVPNTLEVCKEANSINLVDTNELCMVTATKCLMKGNEQMINDDDDDMATEDLVEFTEVNSKFMVLQTSFNNPWFGHQAIFVVYLTHYGCFDRSSEYTARSPPVPPWRVAIPWNKTEMTLGSRPLPWPDPQLCQGSGEVVVQSNNNDVLDDTSWTQFRSNNGEAFGVSTRKLVNLQPWPPPSQWRSEVFSLCAAGGQGLNFSWKCISEGKLMLWTNEKVLRREYTNKVLWLSVANSWDLIWAVLQQLLCTSELILQHGQTYELLLQREQLKLGAVHISLEARTFSKHSRGIELVKCSERCLICLVCEDSIVLHTWAYRVVKLVAARLIGDQGKTIQFLAIWEFANKEVALIQTKKQMHVF
uniref:PTBP1-like RNA recognition motif 2 domain-containing protein n=1 Tax=Oryza glumipatula TaxID=40148 RepID=A0A0E0AS17_9ORYZ